MSTTFKAAVVGTGRMGVFTSRSVIDFAPEFYLPMSHADAINSIENIDLVAISDTNTENLEKARLHLKLDSVSVYQNSETMIQDVKPDLLAVATRTQGRKKIIQYAFDSGVRAVHAEKPLCNSYRELLELKKILKNKTFYLTWGAIRRFLAVYSNVLEIVKSGAYGRLREVRVNFGLSSLFWTHPHSVDLILFAAAGRNISEIQARLTSVDNDKRKVEIQNDPLLANAIISFEDGLLGIITQGLGSDLVFSCENAEISIQADGSIVNIYELKSGIYHYSRPLQIESCSNITGSAAPITSLIKCLAGNTVEIARNHILKKDIINSQAILFAMVQSHLMENKPIKINEIDPDLEVKGKHNGLIA